MNHEKIEDAMSGMSEKADSAVARVATFAIGVVAHVLVYGWVPILTLCTVRLMSLVMIWIDVKRTVRR